MGEIFYNGISLNDLDMPQIRRQKVSYVEQHPTMFNISVQNYLHFGVDDSELVGYNQSILLKMFELEYLLDKEINENGSNLSGGEKQRISIARAMLKDAPIIILDEATASIDPENEHLIQEAISALTHGKTIITIAHRLATIENADQILVIDGGTVAQRGTHKELLQQEGTYKKFIQIREQAEGWRIQ